MGSNSLNVAEDDLESDSLAFTSQVISIHYHIWLMGHRDGTLGFVHDKQAFYQQLSCIRSPPFLETSRDSTRILSYFN